MYAGDEFCQISLTPTQFYTQIHQSIYLLVIF